MPLRRGRLLWMSGGAATIALAAWQLRPEALQVDVAPATVGHLRVTLEEAGLTRVRHHVELAAPLSGRVAESRLAVGDSVAEGQVVARLHPAPLDARVRAEAQATIAQAASRAREARAQWQQLQVALDEARRDFVRSERLAAAGAIPERDREQAATNVRLREGDVEAAAARLAAARDGERASRAILLGADPSRTGGVAPVEVLSPMEGRVLRLFETHDRVVTAGTPLIEIGDPGDLEIVCDVLTRDATRITPGMEVEVRTARQAPLIARVSRIEPAAFTKRSALGVDEQRVNVIADLPGPVPSLGDAFEVDVSIVLLERSNVLRLPTAALVPLDSGWGVFRLQDGRARLVPVSVGERGGADVEIRSGVSEGALVIVRPDDRLREGGRVTPR